MMNQTKSMIFLLLLIFDTCFAVNDINYNTIITNSICDRPHSSKSAFESPSIIRAQWTPRSDAQSPKNDRHYPLLFTAFCLLYKSGRL